MSTSTTIIVQAPSDNLAAWIGVAGVAVGVVLTTGVEWLRSRREDRRRLRNEVLATAEELAGAAHTLAYLMVYFHAAAQPASLDWTRATLEEQRRINNATVILHRLAPGKVHDAAKQLRDLAFKASSPDLQNPAGGANYLSEVRTAVDGMYDALDQAGWFYGRPRAKLAAARSQ